MVKAPCNLELLVVRLDVAAERLGCAEIEWRTGHGANLARRDVVLALGEESLGVDSRDLVQNRAGIVPRKVEVRVVGHVDEGVGIGNAALRAGELCGTRWPCLQDIGNGKGAVAREAQFAVRPTCM